MIPTKAVMDSRLEHAADVESLAALSRFRREFHACVTARGDELFELADAVLCADGPVRRWPGCRWPRSTAAATARCMRR
jgi:hypothetical protein